MRKFALTAAVTGVAFSLAACGPAEIKQKADTKAQTSDPSPSAAAKLTAGVGDTITLNGYSGEDLKMAVTVNKVVPTTKGSDEYTEPAKGKRFYAVQFTLKNVGKAAYDDSPGNGAKVIDAEDQQYDEDVSEVSAGPSIGSSVKIAPGGVRKGYIVFQVPTSAKITTIQFGLESGMADQTGEWQVK